MHYQKIVFRWVATPSLQNLHCFNPWGIVLNWRQRVDIPALTEVFMPFFMQMRAQINPMHCWEQCTHRGKCCILGKSNIIVERSFTHILAMCCYNYFPLINVLSYFIDSSCFSVENYIFPVCLHFVWIFSFSNWREIVPRSWLLERWWSVYEIIKRGEHFSFLYWTKSINYRICWSNLNQYLEEFKSIIVSRCFW